MKRTSMLRYVSTSILASAALSTGVASAAVPGAITHQGRLFSDAGAPINATLDVTFAIYDAPDAMTPIWSEVHTITFEEGYFSVGLGDLVLFDETIFDGSERYLGIRVDTDPEMTPRARVASVPYAMLANNVNGDITPTSVSIGGTLVIDSNGNWVGSPTGLVGPTGPQGPEGPMGPTGAQGPIGPTGAQGPEGPMGPTGAQGPIGPTGAQGPTGPTGAQGPIGPTGAQGPEGPMGPTGAQGPIGPIGPTGAQGAEGSIGPTGAQGPAGPAGATGLTGPTGAQGPMGLQGPAGPQGPEGPTGAQGPAGPVGPTGATGVVSTTSLSAYVGSSIAGLSAAFVFVGPTATVVVSAGQRLTGSATALMGLAAGSPDQNFDYGLCYQLNGAGPLSTFQTYLTTTGTATPRSPYSATSTVALAAGTYTVGFCVRNTGANAFSANDWVNGYIMVTN